MKPLERGYYPQTKKDDEKLKHNLMKATGCSEEAAQEAMANSRNCEVWLNDEYEVAVRRTEDIVHLSIKRKDLGSRGVYYGAQVGPFTSRSAAVQLCESLKAAGGTCLVQRY